MFIINDHAEVVFHEFFLNKGHVLSQLRTNVCHFTDCKNLGALKEEGMDFTVLIGFTIALLALCSINFLRKQFGIVNNNINYVIKEEVDDQVKKYMKLQGEEAEVKK